MKFAEELELVNGRLEEAKQLHKTQIVELISVLFEKVKDILDRDCSFYMHVFKGNLINQVRIIKDYTGLDLKEAKELVCENKDVFIKLANDYYNKLLSKGK